MIEYKLDRETGVVHVKPLSALAKADFDELAAEVDPFIEERGGLAGIVLEIERFPGWEDFGAAIRHLRFVRDHHRKVGRIAVVTDSTMLGVFGEHVSAHFVAAEIRHFEADRLDEAKAWIAGERRE